ncbi:MAG: phage tail tape measure protein [Anaerolineaceae bacterium]|nr:phage tail tape measure protein [Anaerolineaceae bacterium]
MSISETVVSNLVAKLIFDTSGFTSASDSVSKSLGLSWDSAGKTLKKAGAVTAGVTAAAVNSAMKFETAFTGVKKTVEAPIGKNAEEFFSDLKEEILDLSGELPVAADEIANVYQAAGQLGIASENLTGFSKAMIQLASATNLSTDEAATGLAQFANVMGTDQTLFENMGSAIVALGNNFATNERQIVSFAQEMAIAGKLAGLSEADVLGFGTAMASMGLDAASSGTAFQRFTQTLIGEVATWDSTVGEGSSKLSLIAETAGMTSEQFVQAWGTDATGAIQLFLDGLGQMDVSEQLKMFDELDISQQQEITMLQSLASNTDLVSGAINMSNQAWNENTALATEAGAANQTTAAQFQLLKNNISRLAITVGDILLPAFNYILEAIQPLIEKIRTFAQEHPTATKVIIGFGLALGAIGSVITTLLPLITLISGAGGLAAIGTALGGVMTAALPVIGVVALVVAAFLALKWAIENNFLGLGDRFEELKQTLGTVKEAVSGYWSEIKAEYENNGLEGVLVKLGEDSAALITSAIEGAFDLIEGIGASALGMLQDAGNNIATEISGWWDSNEAAQAVSTYCGEIKATFDAEGIPGVLEKIGQDAATLMGNGIQAAFDLLGDIGGSALQLVQDAWANIKKEFESWANDNPAIQAVKSFVDGVIGFFQNLFDELVGHSIVPDLIQSVIDCFSGWWESISGSVQAVKDGIIGFFNDISNNVNTVVENVKQGVLDIWDGAKKTASNVWHWATDWITGGNKGEENQETDESLGSIDMPANMITLDYSDLQPISSEVIESYQALADAIWDMNAALTGQSKDSIEEGMTGVGQGTEEGPVGLSTILSELPDKFTQNQTAAQALADYLTGDFITAINALKKQLAIVETDEKTGEQNASGGNTLYNALGVVKTVLEDIYSISKQIANHWKKDFVEAVQSLKKAADIAIQVTESLKTSALEAADAYGQWADEIQRVIDKLTELGSLQLPSGGGGVPGKAVGGPVQGGSTYLVGEKGPELFTPTRSGYIVPNEDLYMESGGGTSITIQFNGDVIGDEATITEYVDRAARQAIREEIYAAI